VADKFNLRCAYTERPLTTDSCLVGYCRSTNSPGGLSGFLGDPASETYHFNLNGVTVEVPPSRRE
jgi:hypothetical protein